MELPVKAPDSGGRRTTSYRIETESLSYKLHNSSNYNFGWFSNKKDKETSSRLILQDVNFEANPGEVTAIAGPSGAGKTTLLEILAAKIPPSKIHAGKVLINSCPLEPKSFRRLSGHVTQEDALFPLLTVEETLIYSALLRLPGERKGAAQRVRKLMNELGLDQVAQSRICGSPDHGISGGEKRRVSIGVELVHDPSVLLIDEPTSGLDSVSALNIMSMLKTLAIRQGKTIVITIHQPGSRILELLDRVVLLSDGILVHNGPLSLLDRKLRAVGHHIPPHVNALEFSIDVLSTLAVGIQSSTEMRRAREADERPKARSLNPISCTGKSSSYPNSRYREVQILGERFCKNIFRTKQLFAGRIIQAVAASIVLGTLYLKKEDSEGDLELQTRLGLFAFTLTFLLSSTTEGLPIFLQERRILMRETSRGAYRVCSYVLANTLVFLPFLLTVSLLYATPVYWLAGLRGDLGAFLYFSLVVWMVVLMSNSFVACFSALVPNFIMGTSVIAGLMGSFFLFSGYFIDKDRIPKYWTFMHYLSLFKYPFECFLINEYGGERGKTRCLQKDLTGCSLYGDGFLRQQGLQESQRWTYLAVMLGFIFGYRILSFLILWYRCHRGRD
ncbi:ABC transporter G family member 10-like [Chenopodium quinoa]|uniref:ABC transporter G family member 10-like n=1 Tax=Chenopodium quinoa TaxID=63459 RepID=UPI000B77E41D|nr:ABC transporter G family member 10-like [Chenopodium quinoa]